MGPPPIGCQNMPQEFDAILKEETFGAFDMELVVFDDLKGFSCSNLVLENIRMSSRSTETKLWNPSKKLFSFVMMPRRSLVQKELKLTKWSC